LLAQCQDLDLAQDALQDACVQASEKWTIGGMPKSPAAWLLTVSRRRLIDRLRRSSLSSKETIIETIHLSLQQAEQSNEAEQLIPDERLKLIFTCCHPALSPQARVALTLRILCGLKTREIARAFLISESTLQQRLVRAKHKIRSAGVGYKIPKSDELGERLPSVLEVIYLIYNESYSAYQGQTLTRQDLAHEAIRLARVLHMLLPLPQVQGLLALLLLHQSRNMARCTDNEVFIPLEDQDRSLWDQKAISEGRALLLTAMAQGQPDGYQLQAAISALHVEAESWDKTDWAQIELLYVALMRIEPSPVVELNHAVAVANGGRPQEALTLMTNLEEQLEAYQPFFAARAHILTQLSQFTQAQKSYQRAIALSSNNAERDFLIKRLAELD
jgi:RNA polymerase sigma-70 factor (ECF subfamily)